MPGSREWPPQRPNTASRVRNFRLTNAGFHRLEWLSACNLIKTGGLTSAHQAPTVAIEKLQYGGRSAGSWPLHQITQQLLLPGIATALVERQVGAMGVRIPTQGDSREARDAGTSKAS